MYQIAFSLLLAICGLTTVNAQTQVTNPPSDPLNVANLEGHWTVDLRPAPDAEPYLQELVIGPIGDQGFTGSFYNTTFKNGKTNTAWGRIYFAFKTKAGKSNYYSSGYLQDGILYGMTFCEERDFVVPWTGRKGESFSTK